MTEQQDHLKSLIQQSDNLAKELQELQAQVDNKRQLLLKVQGAIEYLMQTGVKLDEEPVEESVEEPTEDE